MKIEEGRKIRTKNKEIRKWKVKSHQNPPHIPDRKRRIKWYIIIYYLIRASRDRPLLSILLLYISNIVLKRKKSPFFGKQKPEVEKCSREKKNPP